MQFLEFQFHWVGSHIHSIYFMLRKEKKMPYIKGVGWGMKQAHKDLQAAYNLEVEFWGLMFIPADDVF